MLKWYEKLFNDLGNRYLDYDFTKGTQQEVDFLEELFEHDQSIRVLDVGCGAGRHSVELAKRHYHVVGLDLSLRQLQVARERANGLRNVAFVRADARSIPFISQFDWAISLCEGAFGLLESDRDNEIILSQVFHALKPDGKFLLNALSAAFAFRHPEYDSRVDVNTCMGYWTEIYTAEDGRQKQLECCNRYYTFPELKLLLKKYGFHVIEGWGCQVGQFRKKEIELDDFELLILAQKK